MSDLTDATAGLLPGTTGQADLWQPGVAGSAGFAAGTGTGQAGVVPVPTNGGGGMISDAINDVWTWINTPFTTPLSPGSVFLGVGVVLVAILIWNLLLYHVRLAAETI